MNQDQLNQFNEMVRTVRELAPKVDKLLQWMEERKRQQLSLPLDVPSISVLNEAFKTRYFDVVKTRELFLKPGFSVNPSSEGQILYHENSGTQVVKIYLDGAVKTITTS